MKIFWFEVKKAEEKGSILESFGVSYNSNGIYLDGQKIARNNRTYTTMYRINTDIRGAIRELRETSMKSGYECQIMDKNWNPIVQNVPEFESMLKSSWGIKKIKNSIVKNLKIYGNVFIQTTKWNVRNQPLEIRVLDPRYVTIVTDSELVPVRYLYAHPSKKWVVETILPVQMKHVFDDDDGDNPAYWMTEMETIVMDVMTEDSAQTANFYMFENGNIPPALYILKPNLTEDQIKKTYAQINETLKGASNKHKAIVSTGIEKIETLSNNMTDMEHEKTRKFTTQKVCVALWVPRTVLGYVEDVNHSNWNSQYEKFIENTIRPLEVTLTEIFDAYVKTFNEMISFVINDEHINDIERRSKLAQENAREWLWTRNEAREYIGYERNDNEMMDEITIPSSYTPLDAISEPVAAPIPTAPEPVKIKFTKP